MRFEDFIKKGLARRASKDISLAKSVLAAADNDLKFLKSLEINELSARKIMSNYYDVLRSILEAISILNGYKIYSHEAFTYFLSSKGDNIAALKFDRFRKIRNGINYYGKTISVQEVKANAAEVTKLIASLKAKYLEKI